MPYSDRMQRSHMYSVLFAPRGYVRMADLGQQLAQMYLSPFDRLIGLVGDSGSGKSMLIKGMFPGLELTNDDEGVNVRPLPLLSATESTDGFYSPHTYHIDVRFESAFTQMHVLADAILDAVEIGKRVIVEHFELVYPFLPRNAHLLIGIGEEIILTRPTLFGPEPMDIAKIVFKSIKYRRMTHSAEDLCTFFLHQQCSDRNYIHGDVRHGFILGFDQKPDIDIELIENQVNDSIKKDTPICYKDDNTILIGKEAWSCTGPRMHVRTAGEIQRLKLNKELLVEPITNRYLLIGIVGENGGTNGSRLSDLNRIIWHDDE
ncbi:alanine-tRNA synthetase second additional domain-containing protein [Clostridiaceae bacterium OttesenSCG-928-D20]|nr:alanine-tRNA synthetase second additional domain-containing protein [Clostridiaceae bacterium OttesenSCG-928-D20]